MELPPVLPSAVTFFFLPVLTRRMSRTDFGTMSALTALYALFSLAFTLYLDRSLMRLYYAYEGESRRELVGSLFIAVLGIATLGLLASVGLSSSFEHLYPQISAMRFSWYAASIYFTVIVYFARTYYTAAEKPLPYLWISFAVSVATALGMYWFVVVRGEGVDGWLKATIAANAAVAVPSAIAVAGVSRLKLRWMFVKEALIYAGPMVPALIFTWLSGSADRLLVGRWAGMNTNALYGAATQLSNVISLVFQPVSMAYLPVFYRLSSLGEEGRLTAGMCNRVLLILIAAAGWVLITLAPLLSGSILPASYRGVSGTFAWLVVGGCLNQAAGLATNAALQRSPDGPGPHRCRRHCCHSGRSRYSSDSLDGAKRRRDRASSFQRGFGSGSVLLRVANLWALPGASVRSSKHRPHCQHGVRR